MNSYLLFILFFGLSKCEDWCLVVTPNHKYEELSITRNWKGGNENNNEFVMYNRVGYEWVFSFPSPASPNPTIQLEEGSIRPGPALNVINRFALYYKSLEGYKTAVNVRLIKKV